MTFEMLFAAVRLADELAIDHRRQQRRENRTADFDALLQIHHEKQDEERG